MSKGRKATPDSIKKMKGTDQPCRLDKVDTGSLPVITKLPQPKGLTPKGRKLYKQIGTYLMNMGILTELNFAHFYQYIKETELYLATMDSMPKAEDMIHRITDKNFNVYTKVKAMRKLAQDALNNSRSLGAEFGLTPTAQAKILGMVSKKPENPLDIFLNNE